jgi:hypothetical protein
VKDFVHRFSRALMQARAGGFLATPPDFQGNAGLGIPGISGIPQVRRWDAAASADAPDLVGDEVHFVALPDGTLVVDEDEPDGSLAPLAGALEETIRPPYRAEALRQDGSVWAASAVAVTAFELEPGAPGDTIQLTRVGGERHLSVDEHELDAAEFDALDELAPADADFALRAERVDDTWWVATVDLL